MQFLIEGISLPVCLCIMQYPGPVPLPVSIFRPPLLPIHIKRTRQTLNAAIAWCNQTTLLITLLYRLRKVSSLRPNPAMANNVSSGPSKNLNRVSGKPATRLLDIRNLFFSGSHMQYLTDLSSTVKNRQFERLYKFLIPKTYSLLS